MSPREPSDGKEDELPDPPRWANAWDVGQGDGARAHAGISADLLLHDVFPFARRAAYHLRVSGAADGAAGGAGIAARAFGGDPGQRERRAVASAGVQFPAVVSGSWSRKWSHGTP